MAEPFVAYDYVFPVVGGDLAPQAGAGVPGYVIRQVYGTAFCLAEDFFVTNRHVIENASAHPWWGLGFPEGRHWRAVFLSNVMNPGVTLTLASALPRFRGPGT